MKKLMHELMNRLNLMESWVICFILGIITLNYPFIQIFNKPAKVWGIPLLYLYFFGGWGISIGVIYLFTRALDHNEGEQDEGDQS